MQSDLKALEFSGIQRLLEKLTHTPYGAEAARNIEPAPEISIANRMQTAVGAARLLIERNEIPALSRLPDIRAALHQASQSGAALQGTALHHIRIIMRATSALKPYVQGASGLYPGAVADLESPAQLDQYLEKTINANGYLREDASEKLHDLHMQIKQLRGEVSETLKQRLREDDLKDIFDAKRIAWQGNRGLLTLPIGHSEKIKGVKRGAAPTGRDQLVEPMEVVALNNRLEGFGGQLDREQQVVRRAITDIVRLHVPHLNKMLDALTWIDLAFAAGQLSVHLNATAPKLVDVPLIKLDRAYHPAMLLQFADGHGPQPVPLTLQLDDDQPMLIITGPNTGGKTVALKTLGLLVTMAHCGLHIPADGDCVIGNFRRVIVDIGDTQSLYHHLSTFAGHVEVLKRLINEADENTLVLMDELGTGTDPEEGAALAMAVLDELAQRGVYGMITTHLSPLKAYAEQHAHLRNASMVFDQERLVPTYQLQIGVSGVSHGLIIAGKNGLPRELLERAREHLSKIAPQHSANRKL